MEAKKCKQGIFSPACNDEEGLYQSKHTLCCAGANKDNTKVLTDISNEEDTKVIVVIQDKALGLDVEQAIKIQKRYDLAKIRASIKDGIITITVPTYESILTEVKLSE